MQTQKVSWGIAGLGNIALRFAEDLVHHTDNSVLSAVASRNYARSKLFSNQFSCPVSYGSYQALAEDPNIDVVYVATINPYHKALTKLFLENGKHVLVEKPAFVNVQDWDEMKALADKNNRLLIEAMKTVTFPAYRKLLHFLIEHKIKLTYIEASFGFSSTFHHTNRLFDKRLSGGATLDVGIYPLWLYCDLIASLEGTFASPEITINSERYHAGVDENVELLFNGSVKAKLCASITQSLSETAVCKGPNIEIIIVGKWWNPYIIEINWQGNQILIDEPVKGGGFQYEAQHIADLILKKQVKSPIIRHKVSRQVIELMENILRHHDYGHLVESS